MVPPVSRRSRTVELASPLDLHRTLSTVRRGPGDPAYHRAGDDLWRTTRLASGPATLRLRLSGSRALQVDAWGPGADEAVDGVDRWFPDSSFCLPLDAHPHVADAHRRFPGLRPLATGRLMEALVPAVLEQKVLGADAFASWRRLLSRFGSPAPGPTPVPMRVVPTSEQWAAIASWDWHLAGVDPQRYRTVHAAARLGDRLERLAATAPPDQVYRALRAVPGIGAWTVAETARRALGDLDAVPWGDYHLANLVGVGLAGERVTHAEVPPLLERYRPYRGHVVRLLQLSPHVLVERRGPRNSRVDHRSI